MVPLDSYESWYLKLVFAMTGPENQTSLKKHLEPQTTICKWLFQLDDSQSLHRKWLEITKHLFINGWPWGSRQLINPSLQGPLSR